MPTRNQNRRLKQAIKDFDFESAFNEVGWDRLGGRPQNVTIGEDTFILHGVAQKRDAAVYRVEPMGDGSIPPREIRKKIDREVTKLSYEHLLVYADRAKYRQIWQWVRRRPEERDKYREHTWYASQDPERLVRRFRDIEVRLDEEEALTLSEVTVRLEDAFDKEDITSRFYDKFDDQRSSFLDAIEGVSLDEDRDWYASVLLNRLMFVYFLQRKGFLDGDSDYLRNRLDACQQEFGDDEFYSFYRTFLLHLFHDGLGKPAAERDERMADLVGDVPYLNGGFFQVHELEEKYENLNIPDEAFESLFDFFEQWDWTLDYRPISEGNEINPDVLGYIFEQYVNRQQMGAYYTKEDVTGYITRNTLLPYILQETQRRYPDAFSGSDGIWSRLCQDPDSYIHPALQQTERDENGDPKPFPDEIRQGLHDADQREKWNSPTPTDTEWGLPTEIWRETVERRQSYDRVRESLAAGEVSEVYSFITHNLDIEGFVYDTIRECDDPELLRAFRKSLRNVKVLDPACGSGAFLFSALGQLEELYTACLERMEEFIGQLDSESTPHPEKFRDFREEIETAYDRRKHPNLSYFVLKRILLDNLYGVDIMPEAVEICKLRLFLKLAAQVDRGTKLEPLPDIDFNVVTGNSVVGYATRSEALRGLKMSREKKNQLAITFENEQEALDRIEIALDDLAAQTELFRQQQKVYGGRVTSDDKAKLKQSLSTLTAELDSALALEYGIDLSDKDEFERWKSSHQPFHWFAEFYDVMQDNGFDVVIGNPPYIRLSKIEDYDPIKFDTISTGDLYSIVMERCIKKLKAPSGWQGYIVPVSSISTPSFQPLQSIVSENFLALSSFDDRPSKLFDGLEHCRLTVHLLGPERNSTNLFTSHYHKWLSEERKFLFDTVKYTQKPKTIINSSIPKSYSSYENSILDKMSTIEKSISDYTVRSGESLIYYTRKVGYFLQILDFIPKIYESGKLREPSELKTLGFQNNLHRNITLCLLNSSLFRWYFNVHSDCRNLNKRDINNFPSPVAQIANSDQSGIFQSLSQELMEDLKANSEMRPWGDLTIQNIIPRKSKSIIDSIDQSIHSFYSLSPAESDFIVNYDVKYRMGIT